MTTPTRNDAGIVRSLLPIDMLAGGAIVVLSDLVILGPFAIWTPIRRLLGLLLLFFLPGYALVSALFPSTDGIQFANARSVGDVPGAVERLAIGFGVSVLLLPLYAFSLWYTVGISDTTLAMTASGFFAVCSLIMATRRARLLSSKGFSIDPNSVAGTVIDADSSTDLMLNVALVVIVIVACSTFGFALVTTTGESKYTNIMLLTENGSGEYVSDGYPISVTTGRAQPFVLGIQNEEGLTVEYRVVVQLQRVESNGTSVTVTERSELRRLSATINSNRTRYLEHKVRPDLNGSDLRLTYLVYRSNVPASPSTENAYRHTYVWLDSAA